MLYRNKVTGVIVDIESEAGGVWKPVEAPAQPASDKPKKPIRKTVKKSTKKAG